MLTRALSFPIWDLEQSFQSSHVPAARGRRWRPAKSPGCWNWSCGEKPHRNPLEKSLGKGPCNSDRGGFEKEGVPLPMAAPQFVGFYSPFFTVYYYRKAIVVELHVASELGNPLQHNCFRLYTRPRGGWVTLSLLQSTGTWVLGAPPGASKIRIT